MKFVKVVHPEVGEATVPEITVPNLPEGWELVDEAAITDTDPPVAETPVVAAATDDDNAEAAATAPAHAGRRRSSHEKES